MPLTFDEKKKWHVSAKTIFFLGIQQKNNQTILLMAMINGHWLNENKIIFVCIGIAWLVLGQQN